MEGAKSKLILRGFKEENILMAKLDEPAVLETMLQWFGLRVNLARSSLAKLLKINNPVISHRHQGHGKLYNKMNFIESR